MKLLPIETENSRISFRVIQWLNLNYAALLLIVLYISEAYFKFMKFTFGAYTLVPRGIKLVLLLLFLVGILYKRPKLLTLPLLIVIFFCIGQWQLNQGFQQPIILALTKLLYPILFLMLLNVHNLEDNQKVRLLRVFEGLFIFNSLLIILGYFFRIFLFKTYTGTRFGYDGLIINSTTASYAYILFLIYLLVKYKQQFFNVPITYLILLTSFFIGTKAIYIFIIGLLIIYVFLKFGKRTRFMLILSVLLISGLLGYIFFFQYGLFSKIQETEGIITSIMSYRDRLFLENTWPYIESNWNSINYLFGGLEDLNYKSQIDFVDIFCFFGIIGGLLYLYTYFKAFATFEFNLIISFLLSVLLIIVFLAGNFFSYPSIVIYLVIVREFLKHHEQDQFT